MNHEGRGSTDVWSGKSRWRERWGERDQKREHKLAIICQCREQKKCSKSYSSKRQGQHWWSELFVFLLTPFIPNEMCNQSDVVLRKHFSPPVHQHPQTHNWFWNAKRQNMNPYSIIFTHTQEEKKKTNDNYLKQFATRRRKKKQKTANRKISLAA